MKYILVILSLCILSATYADDYGKKSSIVNNYNTYVTEEYVSPTKTNTNSINNDAIQAAVDACASGGHSFSPSPYIQVSATHCSKNGFSASSVGASILIDTTLVSGVITPSDTGNMWMVTGKWTLK